MNPFHTTKLGCSLTSILAALNAAENPNVTVKYKKNTRPDKSIVISEFAEKIQTYSLYELSNEVEYILSDFYDQCTQGEVKEEDYVIRRHDNLTDSIEINEFGYILFDSLSGIRSVLPLNIISVIVDGVLYVR